MMHTKVHRYLNWPVELTSVCLVCLHVIRSLKYHQPIYGLRRRFIYSNFPYITAGLVAQTLAAVPVSWEELMISRIFRPLNMTSSTFVSELRGGEEMTRLAAPYCLAGDRLATGSSSNSAFSRINETLLQ